MTATLINAFIVPADKEEEFLENLEKNDGLFLPAERIYRDFFTPQYRCW